jgi:hypothetical protein
MYGTRVMPLAIVRLNVKYCQMIVRVKVALLCPKRINHVDMLVR